ncbi:MAG TPA: organomercurial lyase [Candidatus Binatia bacterium]
MDVASVRQRLLEKWTSPKGLDLIRAGGPLVASLMQGKPVSLDEAGRLAGVPADQILDWWAKRDYILECDSCGNVVGAGLSIVPARHSFEIEGRTFWAWCAMDCLMFAVVLGKEARVRSTCPVTGTPITMLVGKNGVREPSPASVVVTIAWPDGPDIRKSFCDRTSFYATREAALEATAEQKDVAVATLEEAFAVGKDLAALF